MRSSEQIGEFQKIQTKKIKKSKRRIFFAPFSLLSHEALQNMVITYFYKGQNPATKFHSSYNPSARFLRQKQLTVTACRPQSRRGQHVNFDIGPDRSKPINGCRRLVLLSISDKGWSPITRSIIYRMTFQQESIKTGLPHKNRMKESQQSFLSNVPGRKLAGYVTSVAFRSNQL